MTKGLYALAVAIVIGSMGGACIMKRALLQAKMNNRTVTVKGLAEKKVKADRAVWVIPFNATDNNLAQAQQQIDADTAKIITFLKSFDFTDDEISKRIVKVFDRLTEKYSSKDNNALTRYIIEAEVIVKSHKVDHVFSASQSIDQLVAENVTIAYDDYRSRGPRYIFTKITDIKPNMLAQAIQEARKAVDEFAKHSNSHVGPIKTASQGVFSILADDGNDQRNDDEVSIDKVVRVVSTIEYYLKN